MADKRIVQTKKIFVETEYDNIVLVNPNEIYDPQGNPAPRLVDHEDLVYYANLETFIVPRTKLAIGDDFKDSSPVFNTTIATLFSGDDNLKLNFLQPKGKKDFDSSWTDQFTGKDSRIGGSPNQKQEELVSFDNKQRFKNSVRNYEDTQLFGIKTIRVNIKGTGVPEVNIEMTDIQGKALFEQGESSIYSAFFNFPYPLFYLTLKGYYGKAIRYRLSLLSFNARLDSSTGNFDVSLKLVGKFTALLFDTPLQYAITAPKMYNTEITVKDPSNSTITTLNTYKGRQIMNEVYDEYERKGLLEKGFPRLTIEEFIDRANNYAKKLEEDIKNKGDFSRLNDIQEYRDNLSLLKKSVYTNSLDKFLDKTSFYVSGNLIYYPYKKEIDEQVQKDYETKIEERIKFYGDLLDKNESFGIGKKYEITHNIKSKKDVIKNFDIVGWLNNTSDLAKTYYYRTGKQLNLSTQDGQDELQKFKLDEDKNKELTRKVLNSQNQIVDEPVLYYVFGDHRIADGTFEPNSFLDKIDKAEKNLAIYEETIEKELAQKLSDRQLNNPQAGGLGFRPTIRNIFAIIFAGADTFYRLMEDVHQEAWNVREETARLLAVIPPDKSFSVDGLNSIQKSSGQLNKDNVVYPWPLYFTKEQQKNGSSLYVINYPGDANVIRQTKAFDYKIWPEVGFVEAYLKGTTEKAKPESTNVYKNPTEFSSFVSSNALEFPFKTPPYTDIYGVPFFYELFERTYMSANYSKLISDIAQKKQLDKFYGDIESKNVELAIGDNIEITQLLQSFKFKYETFLEYLKKISTNGQGIAWQNLKAQKFYTPYLIDLINNPNNIYSLNTLSSRSIQISADLPLAKNLETFLKDSESNKLSFTDTYPYTSKSYFQNPELINDTTKIFIYLDDKKTIAIINETDKYKNIGLIKATYPFKNFNQPYISTTNAPVQTRLQLKDYFEQRVTDTEYKKMYLTEGKLDYTNYSGNVSNTQTISLLNTPYFINALQEGVEKSKIQTEKNPYVALGYLFLESLPLSNIEESIKNRNTDDSIENLANLGASLKKYSAIHQVPYAWVLKYGAIWHRYKRFVEDKVDILKNVWKSFNYETNYDPITSASTKTYTLPNYSGLNFNFTLQKTELFPIPSPLSNNFINTGFYPKTINDVHYFLTGKELFSAYTQSAFEYAYTNDKFKLGKNNQTTTNLDFGFDQLNPFRKLTKSNYYSYSEKKLDGQDYLILYPSMGGITIDQSILECVNNNNTQTKELYNNKSVYDGSVRTLWSVSQFGYFESDKFIKPDPTKYLTTNYDKSTYELKNVSERYIEEIFSVFDVNMLNKFEEKFLAFCDPKADTKNLVLEGEISTPTFYDPNKIKNLEQRRLQSVLRNLFLVNKTGITFVGEDVDGKTIGEKQILSFTKAIEEFLNFECVIKIGNPSKFDRVLFGSFSNLKEFVPETQKLTFSKYVTGTLPGDGSNITLLQSLAQNQDAWKTLREYVGFSTIPKVDYRNQVEPEYPSISLVGNQPNPNIVSNSQPSQLPTVTQPNQLLTGQTMQDVCSGQYFNVVDTNQVSDFATYTDGNVYYMEVLDQNNTPKYFCARKVPNSASTTTYVLDADTDYPQTNAVGISAAAYCLSFYDYNITCVSPQSLQANSTPPQQQNNIVNNVSLKYLGDSSTILPLPNGVGNQNWEYINVQKPAPFLGYQVFKIEGDSNFSLSKIQFTFINSNDDPYDENPSPVPYNCDGGANTNYTNVCTVDSGLGGKYKLRVKYFPNAPQNYLDPVILYADVNTATQTVSTNQTQINSNNNQTNTTNQLGTQKSFVSDFFSDMDVEFTSDNIIKCAPLIRLYVTNKIQDPTLNKTKFVTLLDNYLSSQQELHKKILDETFRNLNKNLNQITVKSNTTPSSVNGDTGKLTLYNTLKGFNDKWIAGSDLKYVTIFEDFLFFDRSNSDIGDTYVLDIDKVVKRLDVKSNPDMNLMTVVSNILGDNYFMFFAMPAYINFYGLQKAVRNGKPIDIDIPNSLFGTYLEVDYTDSSPKFLCLYMGNPSEYPKPKENSFIRFDDDSFDLRIPENPLRVSDPNRDYSKTNRVVGFSVDFGIQNQNIFKGLDLDMSEMKNTSESFKIFADIGGSVAGDKVAQQSVSMYSIYKSRSYSCGVEAMGNAMIQPTMYFVLRHVPLFYGPYWIFEVDHNINDRGFSTKFKGTRIPKYSLPNIDNLVINTNAKILQSFKEKNKKDRVVTEEEKKITTDPVVNTTQSSNQECNDITKYPTLPFVSFKNEIVTLNSLATNLKTIVSDKKLQAYLFGLALSRPLNAYNPSTQTLETINYNMFEISTENKFQGSMDTYLEKQLCMDDNGNIRVLASFTDDVKPINFMVSFYNPILPLLNDLIGVNPDINDKKSFAKAASQLVLTTWDTSIAFGPPQLNALEIKNNVETATNQNIINTYQNYINLFIESYEIFVE
jgi:hypothetical protein